MKKIEHQTSQMIRTSEYNEETGDLVVTFKDNQKYKYENVLTEDYQHFVEGTSAGRAFNQFIKKYGGCSIISNDSIYYNEEINENSSI